MEKVLTTNNGESNWQKLSVFGLHSRRSIIGFNSYGGRNGSVFLIDKATGMRVLFMPGTAPKSERERTVKTTGKRGRPSIVGCKQQFGGKKVGRPAIFSHPKQAHEPGIRGRKPMFGPVEQLIFAGPHQKRGPKPMQGPKQAVSGTQLTGNAPKKRGRVSIADQLKAAKAGDIVREKSGYWTMLACGIATWTGIAA
jgi:hypothetical protein